MRTLSPSLNINLESFLFGSPRSILWISSSVMTVILLNIITTHLYPSRLSIWALLPPAILQAALLPANSGLQISMAPVFLAISTASRRREYWKHPAKPLSKLFPTDRFFEDKRRKYDNRLYI